MTVVSARCDVGNTYLPLDEPTDVILVDRLMNGTTGDVDLATVTQVINRSRADLAGAPPGAMPELLERLVRTRLG